MGRRPYTLRTKPSFVKVLFQDFSDKLLIPPNFVRLHSERLGKKCILQPTSESDKQTSWRVKTKTINNRLYFKKGWKTFVKHHHLRFGDLLVFRCAKDSVFHVDIYDKTCCFKEVTVKNNTARVLSRKVNKVHSTAASNTAAVKAAEEFMSNSEFPCFKMVMRAVYVKSGAYLHLPLNFAKEYDMHGKTRYVKFEVENKVWGIKLLSDGNGSRSRFTRNWTDIVRKKGLRLKDVCVFELINTEDYTFRVTIFKHTSAEEKIRRREDKLKSPSSRLCAKTKDCSSKAVEAANQYLSNLKHPSYAVVMQRSYLHHGYLHVPSTFAHKTHTKPGANNVKLEFLGKEYKAVFHNVGRFSRINKGWRTFVEENSLELGDVCALELINKDNGVIRISVFKSTS